MKKMMNQVQKREEFSKASPNVLAKRPIAVPSNEFKPALKIRPMSIRPVFSTAEESWGESASCKVLLRPSSLPGPFKLKAPSLTAPDTKSPSQTSIQNEPVESVENGTDKISEKQSEQLEAKSKTVEKKENGKNSEALTSNSSTSSSKENFFMKLAEPEASNTWAGTQIVPGKITSTEKLFTTNKESTSKENYWTQCNSIQAKSLDDVKEEAAPKVNSSSGFVFGRMMNERVCTPKKRKIDGEEEESNRSKTSPSSTKILSKLAKSDNEESQDESSETKDIDSPPAKSLVESAIAYEEAKESNRLKLDEVPVVTGEESEENVIQAQCKLFLFEPDSYSWLEKGRGTLRINDQSQSSKALSFQSRIGEYISNLLFVFYLTLLSFYLRFC
uniref:Ran-binding protein 3-like n=1 Tax=Saccoglossus kowalevskii TaxID=10224 RepID=A0ABM0H1Z9_SACKO|nr:PREDICTED: ran-binding protein 3-like [Saccoglossus kowalevskii]